MSEQDMTGICDICKKPIAFGLLCPVCRDKLLRATIRKMFEEMDATLIEGMRMGVITDEQSK